MNALKFNLAKLADTEKLGEIIGMTAKPGDVICLDGDLGAGKTTLSQAIGRGLGVPLDCYITSPSFAILHEYQGRIPMYHMDFYRLHNAEEVLDLGFEEYFYLSGLTVIEWARRAETILPKERLSLEIDLNVDMTRTVAVVAHDTYESMLRQIGKEFMFK